LASFEGVAFALEVEGADAFLLEGRRDRNVTLRGGVAADVEPTRASSKSPGHQTPLPGEEDISIPTARSVRLRPGEAMSRTASTAPTRGLTPREARGEPRPHFILPAALERDRQALERVSDRLAAFRLPSPFTSDVIFGIPPLQIHRALEDFGKAGLLADGMQWWSQEGAARDLTDRIDTMFRRQLELDMDR
jgi:hypothetical protein